MSATSPLAIVTTHFNPCGYQKLRDNYFRFRANCGDLPVFTAEVSFDGRFHLNADWNFSAGRRHCLWQKEALINWMVRNLPKQFTKVAWIDADLLFLNADWYGETINQLEQFPVVQLYETIHYPNSTGSVEFAIPSIVRKRRERLTGHGQPGGAWAARRDWLETNSLYDRNIVGAGDVLLTYALFGQRSGYLTDRSTPAMNRDFRRWGRGVWESVRGEVGLVAGDLVHLYHGSFTNRQYPERNEWLLSAGFDPQRDVTVDSNGLLAWTGRQPELALRVAEYFSERHEDDAGAAA